MYIASITIHLCWSIQYNLIVLKSDSKKQKN